MSLLNDLSHKELKDAVRNDGLIIFAGAGISKSVGLPLWGELVSKIIEHINNNNSGHDSVLNALFTNSSSKNQIFDTLNYIERNNLTSYVNQVLKDEIFTKGNTLISENPTLPLHSKLWQVSKKIVTPNYDVLFESCSEFKALEQQPISNKSILKLANIPNYSEYLLKIHGNISEIDDIIFYESQYENQYKEGSAVVARFKELVANHPILFVGTSMTDPYVNEIIQQVHSIFHNTSAQNFILSTDQFDNANVTKISGDPIHDLEPLLDELLNYKKTVDNPTTLKVDIPDSNKSKAIDSKPKTDIDTDLNKSQTPKSKNELNLYPKPKSYFTGRDKEIAKFKTAIDDGNTFIAIDGPGGIGKTQFVTKCIEKYISDEKVMWFDCKPESHFDTLIMRAGYPELLEGKSKTNRDKFSAFKDKIQDNGFFLFLDNFQETNSKPVFKEFLSFIQDHLRGGCVIVIDRDDIRTVNLTPKRIHIEHFKEKKLEYAKALINHSFDEVTIDDAELVELCNELQGYPLAIYLAILLLSQGERHTDIIARIVDAERGEEISERLLNAIFSRPDATEEERDFMKQFSVFNGSIPEEAVKALIAEEVMNVAPRKLKRKNLISFSNGYYETHPLVKAFCYKKLDDKKGLHEKVADYYIQTRKQVLNPILEERIFYHLKQSEQWSRIAKEIEENGRKFVLLGQLDFVKKLIEKLKELNITKPIFNILSGDIAEIQGNWDRALKYYDLAKNQEEHKRVKAEGMIKCAEILHNKGNVKDALPFYEEAYEYTKTIDSLKKENARAINDIGLVYEFFGDNHNALIKLYEALKVREDIEDKQDIADSLGNIGNIYDTQGELDKALDYHKKSLKIRVDIEDKQGIATAFGNIGNIYYTQGKLDKALEYHQKSLKIKEEIGNKEGIAASLVNIGNIYNTQGELDKALEYQQKGLNIYEEIGGKQGIAASFSNIGRVYDTKGELEKALEYYQKSLKIQEEIGNKQGTAASFSNIGGVYDTQGKLDKALEYHQKSLKIQEEIGNKQGIATSFGNIGIVYSTKGELDKALEYHQRCLKINEEIGNKQGIAVSFGNIGKVYDNQGKLDKSLDYHQKSLKIEKEIGNKQGIAISFGHIGSIYSDDRKKQYNLAINYLLKTLSISNSIGAKALSKDAKDWLVRIRRILGLKKFKNLANQEFEKLDVEMQKHIPMSELLNEPVRKEKEPGRNAPCHCGSGKKFKKCHGKSKKLNEKVIETDQDTLSEDKGEGGLYPYDPAFKDIEIPEVPFSVFEYLRQLSRGKITTQPNFQRNEVWDQVQKSKFIESIILNFPLPPMYLNETKESNYTVIDGLQRTMALKQYYNGEFALSGLEALPKYNNHTFKDLPEIIQSKFEDKKLTVFVLKPSTPIVVVYDLFKRINTGGTQLNRQEVRNGIFVGKSTQLLKELSEELYFKNAIGYDRGISPERMQDREAILRYLSFRWFDYKNQYSGNMSSFVENAMKKINKYDDEKVQQMKNDFERVMKTSFEIWGAKNFRIPIEKRSGPIEKRSGTVNTAILETVCNYLSYRDDSFIRKNKTIIRNNYKKLIENDVYFEAVTQSTGNKSKVFDRFKIAHEILNLGTTS